MAVEWEHRALTNESRQSNEATVRPAHSSALIRLPTDSPTGKALLARRRPRHPAFPVSKQRPSKTLRTGSGVSVRPHLADFNAAYWRRRLFKNTFTRGGQLTALKAWSVKIQ